MFYPPLVERDYTHKYRPSISQVVKNRLETALVKGELEYVMSMGNKLGDYVNLWIAVVDNKVVAKGDNAKDVFLRAKRDYPEKTPFVMKVPSETVMVM